MKHWAQGLDPNDVDVTGRKIRKHDLIYQSQNSQTQGRQQSKPGYQSKPAESAGAKGRFQNPVNTVKVQKHRERNAITDMSKEQWWDKGTLGNRWTGKK